MYKGRRCTNVIQMFCVCWENTTKRAKRKGEHKNIQTCLIFFAYAPVFHGRSRKMNIYTYIYNFHPLNSIHLSLSFFALILHFLPLAFEFKVTANQFGFIFCYEVVYPGDHNLKDGWMLTQHWATSWCCRLSVEQTIIAPGEPPYHCFPRRIKGGSYWCSQVVTLIMP